MREEKKQDKIIAIYSAIEELTAEGADLSSMRVCDIAAKAGIGKGTTYEYFSSKEEMLVKAMVYLVGATVKRLLHMMEKQPSFKEAFLLMLDEMEKKTKQRACVVKYLSMTKDVNLCEVMQDILLMDEEAKAGNPINIMRYLLQRGQREGVLSDVYSQSYAISAIFSKFLCFMMFLDNELIKKDCSSEKMKRDLYEGICRELG